MPQLQHVTLNIIIIVIELGQNFFLKIRRAEFVHTTSTI